MNKWLCNPVIAGILAVVLVIIDQVSKWAAVCYLKDQEPFVIWDGVFELHYLENRGAAFGMLQGQRIFFLIIAVVVLVGVIWLFAHMSKGERFWPIRLIAIFVLAGAWGNMLDRLRLSYVVDFFYFKLINFPVFNVADIYVSVGVAVLAVLIFFYYKDEELDQLIHKNKEQKS
jgi:signal peptidase II